MDMEPNTHINNIRRIAAVIPTYNEAENVNILISKLMGIHPSLSIIIVDDNSPDETAGIVERLQDIYKNLYLVVRDKKRGLGSAYIDGFKYSLGKGYDVIIQLDADLSHSPSYIPEMVNLLRGCDLVKGQSLHLIKDCGDRFLDGLEKFIGFYINRFQFKSLKELAEEYMMSG